MAEVMQPLRLGIVGIGNISGIYLKNLSAFPETEIVSVADLDVSRAEKAASEHGIGKAVTPDQLLADSEVELVLNLTVPKAHFSVNKAALEAGKHVYAEKPFCSKRAEALELVEIAKQKGLLLGGAPDTFLGGSHQEARKLIDAGAIGRVIGGHAAMMCRGHESWHPSPEFYYEAGGGPMLDMGPYYITALVNMLGPVVKVAALTARSFPERTITSEPKKGKVVPVEAYTHYTAILQFASGALVEVTQSFDVSAHQMPPIMLYGEQGSISVPDPNGFGGELKTSKGRDWEEREVSGFLENGRGLGVRDMAYAIRTGSHHRASGDLCLHVLDIMEACVESSESGRHIELTTTVERPQPV